MVMQVAHFEQTAATIAGRASDLLCACVTVTDDRDIAIASSGPVLSSQHASTLAAKSLRIPVRLDGRNCYVVIGEPTNGEIITPRLASAIVQMTINQAAIVERLPNQHELKDKFIADLLHGPHGDNADIQRESQILGVDLSRPRAVILIDASHYILAQDTVPRMSSSDALVQRRARHVIGCIVSFFDLPNETICAYIGNGEVAVLKASSSQDLVAWTEGEDGPSGFHPSWANLTALKRASSALLARLKRETRSPISIAIGRYHPGLRGLARSYRDARAALSIGPRFQGPNRLHCLDGLGVAALVGISDDTTKTELAAHLLSPLDHDHELMETLAAFFDENCSPSTTASRLSIHRNTLSYRLDKIAALIGLDPRHFDDAVQIRLALIIGSLRNADCPRAIAQ